MTYPPVGDPHPYQPPRHDPAAPYYPPPPPELAPPPDPAGRHDPTTPYGQTPPPFGPATTSYGYPPPQYGPAAYGYRRQTNLMAILSLVFAFVFAPAGIVLGHVAKRQLKTSGEEGDELATAGLIVSYVLVIPAVLFLCGFAALVVWGLAQPEATY